MSKSVLKRLEIQRDSWEGAALELRRARVALDRAKAALIAEGFSPDRGAVARINGALDAIAEVHSAL